MPFPFARIRCAAVFVSAILAASFAAAQTRTPVDSSAVQRPVPEWIKAEHAHTIPLRDMAPMPPRGERHEAPPIRVFPRTGMATAPRVSVDTALQTQSIAAPSIGKRTSLAGVASGDYGLLSTATRRYTNLSVGA